MFSVQFKNPYFTIGLSFIVFIIVSLIGYFIKKNENGGRELSTEDTLINSIIPGIIISFGFGFGIFFYRKKDVDLVFDDKDFWDNSANFSQRK